MSSQSGVLYIISQSLEAPRRSHNTRHQLFLFSAHVSSTFRLDSNMDLSPFNQSNLLYTQEALSRYRPGGYHPVSLRDTFNNGRYYARHKLGWGGYSTVWLTKDKV